MNPKSGAKEAKSQSPSKSIDARIKELGDWRGSVLSRVRTLIRQADPEVVEEWKWVKPTSPGVPVWSHDGMICTGASLEDPSGLFNSSLDGNVRRAIDIYENDKINEIALKALIREAVALNLQGKR
jgi:hypothetical protein